MKRTLCLLPDPRMHRAPRMPRPRIRREPQALADFRDVVLVAGRDPYAFKGMEDRSKVYVRADGQGGCADWKDDAQKKKAADPARSSGERQEAVPMMG